MIFFYQKKDSDIQNCLEGVLKDVNLTLRKLHNESGAWDETVTAIVSTILQSDTDNVKSFIVLFGGVLSSKDNSLLRGEGRSGMILTLQWLYHKQLRATLRQLWALCFKSCERTLGKPPYLVVNQDWLTKFHLSNNAPYGAQTVLPCGNGCEATVTGLLKFTTMSNTSPHHPHYGITVHTSANQQYTMNLFHWTSPNCVVSWC